MGAYYYAGGRKVELESDDEHVGVDQKVAEKAGLDTQVRTASGAGPRYSGGVVLAQRSALGADTLASLRDAGALQPVYKRERAVIVALPEVRIEFDNPDQRRAVMNVLAESRSQHTIAEDTDDWIVVHPASGSGDDALKLANDIYERAHPAAASVRFVQFVPKPTVVRS
jgi:hypothetical protein